MGAPAQMPEDMELVVFVNSPIGTDNKWLEGLVEGLYADNPARPWSKPETAPRRRHAVNCRVRIPVGGLPEVSCRRWLPGLVAAVEDLVVR